jgi:hypothetical protein
MSRNSYVAEEFRPAALKSSIRALLDELATLPQ